MEKDKLERHATIIGRVALHEGKGVDNACIEILTNEEVYTVELDYVGEQLLDFVDQNVKALGFLNKYSDGGLRILLDDYEVLDEGICVESDDPDDYSFNDEY